jgi:hypothetical protein
MKIYTKKNTTLFARKKRAKPKVSKNKQKQKKKQRNRKKLIIHTKNTTLLQGRREPNPK